MSRESFPAHFFYLFFAISWLIVRLIKVSPSTGSSVETTLCSIGKGRRLSG
jgi:hypothetical protein